MQVFLHSHRVVNIAMAYYVQMRCNLRRFLFNFSRGYTLLAQTNAYPLLSPCSAWTVGGSVFRRGGIASACNYQTCAVLCARDGSGASVTKESKSKQKEHGSVLMQFVESKEEPKAVTVGAKGFIVLYMYLPSLELKRHSPFRQRTDIVIY